jgi:hypothetical protein
MNPELEELKKIIFSDEWDDDAKQSVNRLEAQLQEAAVAEKLAESPAIKPYIDWLKDKLEEAETRLKTKRTTAIEQEYLFAIIELASRFTSLFTGERKAAIEKQIKHNLDVAKSH